jgi:hypothetical protein
MMALMIALLFAASPEMDGLTIVRTETAGASKRIVYHVYDITLPALKDGSRPYANGAITVSTAIAQDEEEKLLVIDAQKVFAAWVTQREAESTAKPPKIDSIQRKYNRAQITAIERSSMQKSR